MNFHILTLFPEMVLNGLGTSITGRAMEQGKINIEAVNIRDFTKDKHKKVDDYPYGGGAGMLMQAQPVYDACEHVFSSIPKEKKKRVIYVTPQGTPFSQNMAEEFARQDELIFLCGHYEGIDERVLEEVVTDYVSIGDYVLTGGELAAMVMVDAIARLVPGVLNNHMSAETESFHQDLLEYPQYSRPEVWHEKKVPEVLLSGNQKKINEWRLEESIRRTRERRSDLFDKYQKLQECKKILMKEKLLHIDMIELINRGRALLIAQDGKNILLQDKGSKIFYYTALDEQLDPMEILRKSAENLSLQVDLIVLHQEALIKPVEELFGLRFIISCQQVVYTKREQLSVSGLYHTDGTPTEQGLVIRRIGMEYYEAVCEHYKTMSDEQYIKDRLEHGPMFGAFVNEQLAGFIGMHDEGSIGMLEVFPEYRRRGIGKALETYMINDSLQQGMVPYGQVIKGNEISLSLQKSLGLYPSKDRIYWLEK